MVKNAYSYPEKEGDLIESHDRIRIKPHQNPKIVILGTVTRFIGVNLQRTELNLGEGTFLEQKHTSLHPQPTKNTKPASKKRGLSS